MRKIRDTTAVPSKPYKYVDPDDGQIIQSVYYNQLMGRAKEYRRANNFPIGSDFNAQFEQILCANTPEFCIEFEEPSLVTRSGNLAKSLMRWALQGFQVRNTTEAEAILDICRQCNFYDGESGLLKIVCKKCKCSRKKVFLKTEHCPVGKW